MEPVRASYHRDGSCLIWHSDDLVRLRSQHRIVGKMTGILPNRAHNNFASLPCHLLPEAVTLGLRKGWLVLHDCSGGMHEDAPSSSRMEEYERERDAAEKELREAYLLKRKAKHDELRASGVCLNPRVDDPPPSSMPNRFYVPTARPTRWWGPHPVGGMISLERWMALREFTPLDVVRSRVYADLWEQGLYVTSGCKFGGDYLVYKGDPLLVHASYVLTVVLWKSPIAMLDVVGQGRLAVSVKKSTVIASVDPNTDRVTYVVVDWQKAI